MIVAMQILFPIAKNCLRVNTLHALKFYSKSRTNEQNCVSNYRMYFVRTDNTYNGDGLRLFICAKYSW
jgi:hypothetical protein